jgi:hypothetical protein
MRGRCGTSRRSRAVRRTPGSASRPADGWPTRRRPPPPRLAEDAARATQAG